MYYYTQPIRSDELYHHGILGMKWGVRRYQNKDGTLTPAGKRHQDKYDEKIAKSASKALRKTYSVDYKYKQGRISESKGFSKLQKIDDKFEKDKAKIERKAEIDRLAATISRKKGDTKSIKKRAAKYVIDKNMTVSDALRKSRQVAKGKQLCAGVLALAIGSTIGSIIKQKVENGRVYVHNNNVVVDAYSKAMGGLKEYSAPPTFGFDQYKKGKAITEMIFGK